MAQKANRVQDLTNRRRILQGLGALGVTSIAGCFGSGDGGGGGGGDGVNPVRDRVTVDPEDIVEGGTFSTAIPGGVDTFDEPYSSSAYATNMQGVLYEGLITTGADGTMYPWLASSYSQEEVNDVRAADYEPYMVEAEYGDEGAPQLDGQIVVEHPDNTGDGTDMFLTVNEAPDAVADGTYGMRYRFELEEGVEFHNGEEMTADNVVASYERTQGSALSGQVYDALLDVQADGDYAVDFYTQEPDAGFLRNTIIISIWPTEVTDLPPQAHDPRQGNEPMGTGPFVFEEFEPDQYFRATKNENYWFDTDKKDWFEGPDDFPNGPVVDEVDISIVPDPASRTAALRNGEVDLTFGLNTSNLTEFDNSENYRTAYTKGAGFNFFQFPVTVEPFTDARVRRAINHLIPRQQISDNIFNGWELPAWVPMPPLAAGMGTTDYDGMVEDLKSYNEYDQEEAASLVEEAVEENGWETPIEVTINTNANDDNRVAMCEVVVEALNQSDHFNASLDTYADLITMIGAFYQPSYAEEGNIAVVGLSGGFSPHGYAKAVHHPDNYLQCCNFQNIDDDDLNSLLQEARYGMEAVQDEEVRQERYEEVWERVLELNANSYGTHGATVGVHPTEGIYGFNTYPSTQSVVPYALYTPADEQITYIDR
ncbi:family 5 extracellular solute-binding protein [Salinarchaeum sp. Harcht-Bsk1]|uniref:ABC transporter substrate-binding protein n=1 Tax=Salinarchaeum sp. Harcht-Bsk1 TaxID=1333523 RepID=UPI0003422B4F|nr:ABC transporter substrate-binding protein [Salinarchaeum sp. Harcht-Bsk1]AGN02367.1 family 5 extracellular solute-binding protein [Salinarchaeum sp. Harcht-Bsk1]